ncbi:MAG: hypothetical protein GX969_02580 [Firmicutes bacterium]|nr:hypothetical protein [Bacillota bacterium]
MKKVKDMFLIIIITSVLLTGFSNVVLARELARAEIKVVVRVPVMQKLTVLEPAHVTFRRPESGQPLVFTDVGKIRVQSNADWALTVGVVGGSCMDVFIKPSGDRMASWQSIGGCGQVYTGPKGLTDLGWDIMINDQLTPVSGSYTEQDMVDLFFTLSEL